MTSSFIKLPKFLIDLDISVEAKYIYCLLLDRYSLSEKNHWLDEDGNIYLYFTLFDVQKAIGISEKSAVNVFKELENNNLIIRKRQGQGNPAKIFLPNPDLTFPPAKILPDFSSKKIKTSKKDKSRPVRSNVQDLKNLQGNNINTNKTKKNKTNIDDETQNSEILEIIETFKRYIGREPDKSFKKTIAKRLKTGLDIKTVKAAIEKANKTQAKKPEAFILYLTQHNQNLIQYNQTENTAEQEQTQQQTDKPLEEWEVEWLLEVAKYQQDKEKIDQCNKLLDEFSKQRLEKQPC